MTDTNTQTADQLLTTHPDLMIWLDGYASGIASAATNIGELPLAHADAIASRLTAETIQGLTTSHEAREGVLNAIARRRNEGITAEAPALSVPIHTETDQ